MVYRFEKLEAESPILHTRRFWWRIVSVDNGQIVATSKVYHDLMSRDSDMMSVQADATRVAPAKWNSAFRITELTRRKFLVGPRLYWWRIQDNETGDIMATSEMYTREDHEFQTASAVSATFFFPLIRS